MTSLADVPASTSLIAQLANSAVRALILAGGVGFAVWIFRVKTISLRLFTWTAVLYAALALPLLGWMLPPVSVSTPSLFQNAMTVGPAQSLQVADVTRAAAIERSTVNRPAKTRPSAAIHQTSSSSSSIVTSGRPQIASTSRAPSIPWMAVATAVYFTIALLLLMRFVVGIVLSGRLIRGSKRIHDHRVTSKLASRAIGCGLDFVPPAAEAAVISVPITMGALRPTILLPANWREWSDAKLDAVIAHEVSHVARRDAFTQRISLLHRAIFWFSPLTWWLDRHLAELAEQASDETALTCGADRTDYARTLLGFFEALHAAPGRVWWQGVSMATTGQAEKRLERILAWRGTVTMGLKRSIVVAIIALGIPAVYLAASVRPVHASQDREQTDARTTTAPSHSAALKAPAATAQFASPSTLADAAVEAQVPQPLAPHAPLAPGDGGVMNVGPAPIGPIAPVAPIAPIASGAGQSETWSHMADHHGYSYSYRDDDEQRFVIVTGNTDSLTVSGSSEDARHAQKLKKQIPGDFIWFERDEKSYIIRDQATIDRARKLWAPQEELGKKQEELGKQQEALGKQQEELGKKMEEIQVKVPDMTAELDRLKAKLQKLGPSASMEQLGDLQSEIGDLQSKIGDVQSQAGERQSKVGEEMGALGEKQGKLGELQGELGRQQGELAEKAGHEMRDLLDEAIKNGKAQPEPQTGGPGTI